MSGAPRRRAQVRGSRAPGQSGSNPTPEDEPFEEVAETLRPTIVPDVEPPAPPVQGVADPEQDDSILGPSVVIPTVGE